MNSTRSRVALLLPAIAAAGIAIAAAHYRHASVSLKQQLASANAAVQDLQRELRHARPNAANVVLAYTPVDSPRQEAAAPVAAPDTNAAPSVVASLQARVRELEAALRGAGTNRPSGPGPSWRSRYSPEALAELERTDPAAYQELLRRREEARTAANTAISEQAEHLLEADVANLSEIEQAQRNQMLQLVSDTWKMTAAVMATPPPANRGDLTHAIHENLQMLGPLLEVERNREFRALALESGYSDADADLYVEYLNDVIEATSTRPFRQSLRGGGRGGPGHGSTPTPAPPASPVSR